MDLLLIRHGQSHANVAGLLISNADDTLSPLGECQSHKLNQAITDLAIQPDLIFVSTWRRARQTAEIVFSARVKEILVDRRLAETDPGIYGTWKESEFNQAFPKFHQDIENQYLGGESHLDMAKRVQEWVDAEVLKRVDQPGVLCAIAHGGPISVVIQYLLNIPLKDRYPSFTVPNASLTILRWRQDLSRYCVERVGST